MTILISLLLAAGSLQMLPWPAEGTRLVVSADSIILQARHDYTDESSPQTRSIPKGNELLVLQAERDAADTTMIWIELAQESQSAGWIEWQSLIRDTAPSGPISRLLHKALSPTGKTITILLAIASLCLCILSSRRKQGLYLSLSAGVLFLMLVVFVLCFSSGDVRLWNYYLSPTLSPFSPFMPFLLRLLIVLFWADAVLWLATLFSLRSEDYMICANCGTRLRHGSETCSRCGARNVE